jgi:hypothetical protein
LIVTLRIEDSHARSTGTGVKTNSFAAGASAGVAIVTEGTVSEGRPIGRSGPRIAFRTRVAGFQVSIDVAGAVNQASARIKRIDAIVNVFIASVRRTRERIRTIVRLTASAHSIRAPRIVGTEKRIIARRVIRQGIGQTSALSVATVGTIAGTGVLASARRIRRLNIAQTGSGAVAGIRKVAFVMNDASARRSNRLDIGLALAIAIACVG